MESHKTEHPHECKVCDRTFKRKEQLRCHSVIHSNEKRFFCDECGKSKSFLFVRNKWNFEFGSSIQFKTLHFSMIHNILIGAMSSSLYAFRVPPQGSFEKA